MKQYNEYGDRLVSLETAMIANSAGYANLSNRYDVECFCQEEDKVDGMITDEWAGLIPDGFKFLYHRPTIPYLRKWLREEKDVYVYLEKSKYYTDPNDLSKKWMIFVDELFLGDSDDFEDGLEEGLSYALMQLID